MNQYRQCLLVNGEATEIAWIPEYLAKIGQWIEVKATGALWSVQEVWSRMEEKAVRERSRDYRNQRKASDI